MKIQCQFVEGLDQIDQNEWNRLIDKDFPFLRYEFLYALERSKSVSKETGWEPYHCVMTSEEGGKRALIAVAPQYLKHHSYGEYVFDWAWADAYQRHGLDYYPKLLTAIPFTPCVGDRLSISHRYEREQLEPIYRRACIDECENRKLSSWHVLFPKDGERYTSLHQRLGVQFHWYNQGYKHFDDFLAALSSRKRKNIKKERQKAVSQGLSFEWRSGADITNDELRAFYACYHATYLKRGQKGYLNWSFFEEIARLMPESLRFLLVVKESEAPKIVAGALFFLGDATLYGRYWGCLEEYEQLHFETCYYQGIDYCIAEGLAHFDAGAQGEHKVLRGFEPIETASYHWLAHPEFSRAVGDFVDQEKHHIKAYKEDAAALLPYKNQAD